MTKKNVIAAAFALAVAGIVAPSASAVCNPPKFASTYNPATGSFAYWHTSLPTGAGSGSTLIGQIWTDTVDYTGTCNGNGQLLYFGVNAGDVGLSMSLGQACVPQGLCPTGNLTVKATVIAGTTAEEFVAVNRIETPAGGVNFDFSNTPHSMSPDPSARPRILSSSRSGTNINLLVATDAYSMNGFYDSTGTSITGWNIMSAAAVADPGRIASSYSLRSFIPAPNGSIGPSTNVQVDCSDITKDQWVVAALVTGAGPSLTVGPPSRVKCNPALADPKYKLVPSPKTLHSGTRN